MANFIYIIYYNEIKNFMILFFLFTIIKNDIYLMKSNNQSIKEKTESYNFFNSLNI